MTESVLAAHCGTGCLGRYHLIFHLYTCVLMCATQIAGRTRQDTAESHDRGTCRSSATACRRAKAPATNVYTSIANGGDAWRTPHHKRSHHTTVQGSSRCWSKSVRRTAPGHRRLLPAACGRRRPCRADGATQRLICAGSVCLGCWTGGHRMPRDAERAAPAASALKWQGRQTGRQKRHAVGGLCRPDPPLGAPLKRQAMPSPHGFDDPRQWALGRASGLGFKRGRRRPAASGSPGAACSRVHRAKSRRV